MLSKVLVSQCYRGWAVGAMGPLGGPLGGPLAPRPGLLARAPRPQVQPVRHAGELIPPTQYDIPISPKFQMTYVLRVYWELIPIFTVTGVAMAVLFFSIVWACKNKVDVVFSTHNCANISRTMDLRHPTVHKIVIIHQRYEPWPEMQNVLDKLDEAEKKAMLKAAKCSQSPKPPSECD